MFKLKAGGLLIQVVSNTGLTVPNIHSTHNPFPTKSWFLRVCSTSPSKTLWEKEKLLVTSNFSFSDSVFYPIGVPSAIFIRFEMVVCKPFLFGGV